MTETGAESEPKPATVTESKSSKQSARETTANFSEQVTEPVTVQTTARAKHVPPKPAEHLQRLQTNTQAKGTP